MKNQTAVEWLIDEIRNQIKVHGKLNAITLSKLKMQAKAMEKMQIIEAYEQGEAEWCPFEYTSAKDYYKRTFKK
jgi:hypothetical protein